MYKIENHKVSDAARAHTHLDDAGYQRMYKQSLEQPDQFWAEQAERFPDLGQALEQGTRKRSEQRSGCLVYRRQAQRQRQLH